MGLTPFPHGVSSFGIPLIGSGPVLTTGSIYFVGSAVSGASDSNNGTQPEQPLATLAAGVAKCADGTGDIIFVMPGHSEAIATEVTISASYDGISIIGIGNGNNRPTFTVGGDIDAIDVQADDVYIANIVFDGVAANDPTAQINVAGDNLTVYNCEFRQNAKDLHSFTFEAGADYCTIEKCKWIVEADGPDEAIDIEGVIAGLVVKDCFFDGVSTTNGWDDGCIVSGSAHTSCLIQGNTIFGLPANKGGIEFSAAATGVIKDNDIGAATLAQAIDPGSCMCFRNYEADAIDETGRVFPTTAAS